MFRNDPVGWTGGYHTSGTIGDSLNRTSDRAWFFDTGSTYTGLLSAYQERTLPAFAALLQEVRFRDQKSGEEVNFTYDAVHRLTRDEPTGAEWGETMTYDGFRNLTAETPTKGTAPSYNLTVNTATNRIRNAGFRNEAAGNMTSNPLQAGQVYFPENRLKQVGATATTEYRYGADGQKLLKGDLSFNDEYTINGPQYQLPNNADAWLYYRDPWGRLRAVIRYRYVPGGSAVRSVEKQWHWFLGAPVEVGSTKWVGRDRLGSVRAVADGYPLTIQQRISYFPYGQERGTATGNDTWRFATYWREAGLGGVQDDAQQRWYLSGWGRFTTADPYAGSGGAGEPGSWNRYAYVGGDPVNFNDPRGLMAQAPYPPGYCPAQYSYQECVNLGFISSLGFDGGGGGGGGGGRAGSLPFLSTEKWKNDPAGAVREWDLLIAATIARAFENPNTAYPMYLDLLDECITTNAITGALQLQRHYQLKDQLGRPLPSGTFTEFTAVVAGTMTSGNATFRANDWDYISAGFQGQYSFYQTFVGNSGMGVGPMPIFVRDHGVDYGTLAVEATRTSMKVNGVEKADIRRCP